MLTRLEFRFAYIALNFKVVVSILTMTLINIQDHKASCEEVLRH